MANKLEQYVEIKRQIKQLEVTAKLLAEEVKKEVKDKVNVNGYSLQKISKVTYSVKKDVNIDDIKREYPKAILVKESVDSKLLFKIADKPNDYVEEKKSEYLTVKKIKQKDDLDF